MTPPMLRFVRNALIILTLIVGVAIASSGVAHVVVNTSDSMPVGLYQLTDGATYRRGDIVIACMPLWVVQYRRDAGLETPDGPCPGNSTTILKEVAAVPGDVVSTTSAGVSINGRLWPDSGLHDRNSRGGAIPRTYLGQRVTVPAGHYWLIGTSKDSFDSRYWGGAATVLHRARPLLIYPSLPQTDAPSGLGLI